MPAITPIYDAVHIVRKAIFEALDPLTTAGVYWQRAAQGVALPFVVYQSQDGGGAADKRLNMLGWQGLFTIKALASSQSAAETLMLLVAPGMTSLSATGYSISAEYERPIVLPPDADVWQCCHQWRVFLEPV